jgi:HlyD family secretion protein
MALIETLGRYRAAAMSAVRTWIDGPRPGGLAPAGPGTAVHMPTAPSDWQSLVRKGWLVVFLVFGLGGLWSVTARLDGGAVAPGVVAVASNRKAIQHLEGGIVKEIFVHEGDAVREGDVLVRLDDTQARASMDVLRKQLAAAVAEEARLVAERDMVSEIAFPDEVLHEKDDPLVARAIADQKAQFNERRSNILGQQSILEARIQQTREAMAGTYREKIAGEEQVVTIKKELVGLRDLLAKNLVQLPRVLALEREESRLRGTIGRAESEIARAEQTIGETRIQIQQLRQQFQEAVSRDLPATRKTIAELREKLRVSEDILRRTEIRAPQSGAIQSNKVFTIGGVIRASETIMEIVPTADELVIRAQLSPQDVDNVHVGDTAEIRFPAFSNRYPPLFFGKVRTLSRDRLLDEGNRQPYFAAEISVDYATVPVEYREKIVAGMQGDVIVTTGERVALQYLLGPLLNRLQFGMREH